MNKTLKLLGEPKSTNHIYLSTCQGKFARMYMSSDGKALKDSYGWQARSQWRLEPLQGDVEIEVGLYFKSKRSHDIDNFGKLLLDSLTGIVWIDDKQIQKMTVEKFHDKDNPRIEITVNQYGNLSSKH